MSKVLRAVTNEFANFRKVTNETQKGLQSIQDLLVQKTSRCFETQKSNLWWQTRTDGVFNLCAGGASLYNENAGKLVASAGNTFTASIFQPRRLDDEKQMRETDAFAQQATRMVQALDTIRQTQETQEQQLQQHRQTASQT